ncbi:MAG: hypothetical protein WCA12_16960 [Burkholderiales bacterium]
MGTMLIRVTIAIAIIGAVAGGSYVILQRDTTIQSTDPAAPPAVTVQEAPPVVVEPDEAPRAQTAQRRRNASILDLKPVPHDQTPLR